MPSPYALVRNAGTAGPDLPALAQSGHNQAAPRTPLESPCTLRAILVTTVSEKT